MRDGVISGRAVSGAATVLAVTEQFGRLKQVAGVLAQAALSSDQGYFAPSEDEEVRHLLVSY